MINDVLPFYEKYKMPILVEMLFASSYENSPGSAGQHWDNIPGYSHFYEDDPSIAINEQVQANMYEAAMVLMHEYDWIIGTNGDSHRDTLMTFITKDALQSLIKFNKSRDSLGR